MSQRLWAKVQSEADTGHVNKAFADPLPVLELSCFPLCRMDSTIGHDTLLGVGIRLLGGLNMMAGVLYFIPRVLSRSAACQDKAKESYFIHTPTG